MRGRRRIEIIYPPSSEVKGMVDRNGFTYYLKVARLWRRNKACVQTIYTLPGVSAIPVGGKRRLTTARHRVNVPMSQSRDKET